MKEDPLVSIVTPAYNAERFLEECIQSVIGQTYEHIEHIIIDGNSTDSTTDILKKYEDEYNLKWSSEPDNGMYHAIEKGFEQASGDIFAWINSDDKYLPWAAEVAVENLSRTGVEWIIGHPSHWNEDGILISVNPIRPYFRQKWIRDGWYHGGGLGWIQQESMFWTSTLWNRKGKFPDSINLAGDYYLWTQFAEETDLVQIGTVIAGFRQHDNQLTMNLDSYLAELPDTEIPLKVLSFFQAGRIYSLMRNIFETII